MNYELNIPTHWKKVLLGELTYSEKGKKPKVLVKSKSKEYNIDYIDIKAFEKRVISNYTDGNDCRLTEKDDILMVWDGSRSGLVGESKIGALGSTLVRIKFFGINNRYAFYFLKSKYLYINSNTKGASIPHVDPNILWNSQLPLAPLNEQTKIVEKIDTLFKKLDNSIEKFEKAKLKLKQYRESVLVSAFTGQLTKKWRQKHVDILKLYEKELLYNLSIWNKKSKKINEISQIDINNVDIFPKIPTDWFIFKLGMIIEQPKYGTSKKTNYQSNGIGVLRIPNIIDGRINDNDLKCAEFNELEKEKYSLLSGDLLVIRSNGSLDILGKSALVTKSDEKHLFAGYLIRIRPNNQIILSELLQYIFQSYNLRKQITKKAKSSSGVNNINSSELKNLIIPIMSIEEQTQIIKEIKTRLNIAREMEKTIDTNLVKAKAMYQSILTKAFRGELVDYIGIEEEFTTEELLKQIRVEKAKYEAEQKKKKRKIRSKKVAKKLSLIETLSEAKNNILKAKELWKKSIYSNDIEGFYSKLKEEIEVNKTIIESRNADNNESYLRLVDAN